MKTKVIFRKFDDGEIIALFPELPGTNDFSTCLSYLHMGQHGSASADLTKITKLATAAEYADLKRELELLGYDLKVCKRLSYRMLCNRINEIQRVSTKG